MKTNILQFILLLFISSHLNAQDWMQIGGEISNNANNDVFGSVVSLSNDGTIMATGFPKSSSTGMVSVYKFENDEWMPMGSSITGVFAGEDFGWSVSLSADGLTLAVGAPDDNGAGSTTGYGRVYEWSGSDWIQKGNTISGINYDDYLGYEISLNADGSMVILGAPKNDDNAFNAGAAYIFQWNGTAWEQRGSTLSGTEEYEEFGQTVGISADGDHIVIGSPYFFNTYHPGVTRVYEWSGNDWVQIGDDIVGEGNLDHSATSLEMAANGLSIAIGSFNNSHDNIFNAGHVRVYDWSGSVWEQRGEDIDGDASYDNSSMGMSLSDDGNTLAVGAPSNDGNGDKSGQIKVYRWNDTEWVQTGSSIYGSESGEEMGRAVALNSDGTILAGAAPKTSSNTALVRTYDLSGVSGVNQFNTSNPITISPNPTRGNLRLDLTKAYLNLNLQVYNSIGQLVMHSQYQETSSVELKLDEPNGFYFIHLSTPSGESAVLKVIKK